MKNTFLTVAAFAAVAPACAVTLTFDELATQPVQSLATSGVSFGFTVGTQTSQDAVYNRTGPTGSRVVSRAALEGDAPGVLTLSFSSPTPVLNFGVALTAASNLNPGLMDWQGEKQHVIGCTDCYLFSIVQRTCRPQLNYVPIINSAVTIPVFTGVVVVR